MTVESEGVLNGTRHGLNSAVDEAANEAQWTSRQQLEALNEELLTTNAELAAVNALLEAKVEELERQGGALSSAAVRAVLLDEELRLRWFTTAMTELIPLQPADEGRLITDLVPRYDDAGFISDAHGVMQSGEPSEAEVQHHDGRRFVRTIRPHGSRETRDGGVVVTFVDVTRRAEAEAALRKSERRLRGELEVATLLRDLGLTVVNGDGVDALYDRMLEAAVVMMAADFASVQLLRPEQDGDRDVLELKASRGFHPQSVAFWRSVTATSATACGFALRDGERSIIEDVEACEPIARSHDIEAFRRSSIRSVQSTPLRSRSGRLLGIISTHWRVPHRPCEEELQRFDLLARQVADLVEHAQVGVSLPEVRGAPVG